VATEITYGSFFYSRVVNGNTTNKNYSTVNVGWRLLPVKVSGAFITLPGGNKFRKATSRSVAWSKLTPYGPQRDSGTYNNQPYFMNTSAGGPNPGTLISAGVALRSGIGSVGNFVSSVSIPSSMRSEAGTKALLDISDQKANISEDLATFRQTLGLIKAPAGALLGSLRIAKSKPEWKTLIDKSAKQIQEDIRKDRLLVPHHVAAEYLKYVYGWKPLMQDIYGVISLLKQQGIQSLLLSGDGYASQTSGISASMVNDPTNSVNSWIDSGTESAKVHCKIWSRIDPNHAGLRSLNQLGLINPLSLAWELTPWSFVVDWFAPIGPVLQALTAPAGLIFVDGSISCRTSVTCDYRSRNVAFDSSATLTSKVDGTGYINYEGYKRETLSNWPLPGIWVNPHPLSGDRTLKALALSIIYLRNWRNI